MGLKNVVAVVLCIGFLALGGAARADEYRASEFLGLDLSRAVLSPKRLGPEAEFAPVPIEARSDRAQADLDASVWPRLPARKTQVAKTRSVETRIVRPQMAKSAIRESRHGRARPAAFAAGSGSPAVSSLRGANGSRECAPDDRLRDEAIHTYCLAFWIASLRSQ